MKSAHIDVFNQVIRQLMLMRRMEIKTGNMTEEEVDALINAEGEKWMQKTKDFSVVECMLEIIKLQHELNEQNKSK